MHTFLVQFYPYCFGNWLLWLCYFIVIIVSFIESQNVDIGTTTLVFPPVVDNVGIVSNSVL